MWPDSGVGVPAGDVLVWETASHKRPGELFNLVGFGHSHHAQILDMYDNFFYEFPQIQFFSQNKKSKDIFHRRAANNVPEYTDGDTSCKPRGLNPNGDPDSAVPRMSTRWWSNSLGTLPGPLYRQKAKLKSLFPVFSETYLLGSSRYIKRKNK